MFSHISLPTFGRICCLFVRGKIISGFCIILMTSVLRNIYSVDLSPIGDWTVEKIWKLAIVIQLENMPEITPAVLINFTKNLSGIYGESTEIRIGDIYNKILGLYLYTFLLADILEY